MKHHLVGGNMDFFAHAVKGILVRQRRPRETIVNPAFGQRLLQRITALYGSQADFARVLGTEPHMVGRYCRGQYPEGGRLVRMAELLRCSVDWLVARPPAAGLDQRVGDLSPELQAAVLTGMALTPEQRRSLQQCTEILASGHPGFTAMFQSMAKEISEMIPPTAAIGIPKPRRRRGPSPSSPTDPTP